MGFTTENIRNIAIAGHGGTGKTTLLEQILFNGGKINQAETVESGKTVSDYTPEEIERGMSIHTSLTHVEWHDHKINLLDTPGAADFVGEVVAAFRAAESAIMLVAADSGVQIETIKLWRRLDAREMPRIVFINKMDRERADFLSALEDVKQKFQKTCVPVTIPIGQGADFKGIVNLIENKAYLLGEINKKDAHTDIPEDMKDKVEEARLEMIEAAAEGADELMEKYFEEGTLSPDDIRKGLTLGLQNNRLVPVLCGSALLNTGIVSFLNFISYAAPSPSDIYEKIIVDGEEKDIHVDSNEKLSMMVFKTSIDQFAGKLSFAKVITGCLKADIELLNVKERKKERISKVYMCEGKKLEDTTDFCSGDIAVLNKLVSVHTNATLCDPSIEMEYRKLNLPQPVHSLAISAGSKKEEDKLNEALHRVTEEDLTFTLDYNKETKENVISGMGELHINIILDKIKDKQKIGIETRVPRIAYRETITKAADAEYTHKKQSGGHGQYGRVVFQVQPLERGGYMRFTNAIKGGSISKGYMPGIEKGILEAMEDGYLAGYPIVDLDVSVVDGKEHPVDSSEMSFKLAARGAIKAIMGKAGAVLLEPVMKLRVFCNDDNVGDILSDLSSKRGRVLGQEPLGGGITEIDAEVPHSEMMSYAIDLKSMTSGTGSFEVEFDHYSPISGKLAEQVIAQTKTDRDE